MSVHQRFKKVIKESGKNANNLASEMNVSHTAISRVLKGENLPSSKLLIPLGEKFGVSIDWLLFGVGEMFIDPSGVNKVNSSKGDDKKKDQSAKLCKKELELLKDKLKEKELLIIEKTKLLEAKDKIINLLEKK
jgi:transcriptional regulator with XRE-family HTH domain